MPIIRDGAVFWRRPDMIVLHALTIAAAIMLPLLALLSFLPFSTYVTDILSHFPLQYLFACLLTGILLFILRMPASWGFLVAFSAALFFMQLYPYWMPGAAEEGKATIKVLQANTLYINKNTTPLRQLIETEDPDVIILAETNKVFADFLETLEGYPYRKIRPATDAYGYAVLSKKPLENIDVRAFSNQKIPAVFFSAGGMNFAALHPTIPLRDLPSRDADFAAVTKLMKNKKNIVIAGDLNATPYCPALKKLSRGLNVRNARIGRGINGSWPVWLPMPFRIPIDHVLVSDDIAVIEHRLGPDIASDHFPTITVLDLR